MAPLKQILLTVDQKAGCFLSFEMREKGKGRWKWFSVEAKSFKISAEGDGRKTKVFITKRSRGLLSWIHFGEEGLKNLLKGINICTEIRLKQEECLTRRRMEDLIDRNAGRMLQGDFSCVRSQTWTGKGTSFFSQRVEVH